MEDWAVSRFCAYRDFGLIEPFRKDVTQKLFAKNVHVKEAVTSLQTLA
jgi:hypothetical protein